MKIAALIARILLGLLFLVTGLNAFLNFLTGPMPTGIAGEFVDALVKSHYFFAVGAVQVIGAALLLVGRYVPLALALIAPVIVNILLFHLFLKQPGIAGGIVAAILWFIIAYRYRENFAGLFAAKAS